MKTKTLNALLAGLLVWTGLAASATAQTIIRIVGSNGDRTATQTAISHILDAGWTYQGITAPGNTSSSGTLSVATGSNFGVWNGTITLNSVSTTVVIKTSYSGALAGIAAVAGGQPTFRFAPNNTTGTGVIANGITSTNSADFELAKADFGFSTNFQSTSPFNGVFQGITYSPVTEEIVGVTPLGFYASPGFPGSPSSDRPTFVPNITNQLAYQLYTKGVVSLALFTGDYTTVNAGEVTGTGDKNKLVYAIGRNTDAGQRYGAHTEIGIGTKGQARQWFPAVTGTTTTSGVVWGGTVNSHQLWPVATQPGTFAVPLGSGGFSSGALVAQNLTSILSANAYKTQYTDPDTGVQFLYPNAIAGYYIGYATPGDADKGVLGTTGAVPDSNKGVSLRFNGVALSTANVKNGTYTAWLYNRLLKPQSGLTGDKLTFANTLRDQIANTADATASGGFADDATVFVQRFTDGGAVTPK